ncbi:homeobox protein [Anaeramoeba flamelloides]|uniref:Homeobox protein n=1 Tax=Anaeramoeba flamelloides TaxID=1746091 RepID=A0ABQ8YES0_9EUKA|nr:homeobox protein [Anaeramoeba flamelloides]
MSEEAPIVKLFSLLLVFVCWVCGLLALPVIAAFKLSTKFLTSTIFSPEPSGNRASHAFLWPVRLILALLGPIFFVLEIGAFVYIGYTVGKLMFEIIFGIVGILVLIIGMVWANRGDGHFQFLPEFEFQEYWHGFIDSLFDLGAFFCLIVAILSVVRIPYLIGHLKKVDEPLRAKLFFEVPNALIELLMLPMYIVIFLCQWRFYRYLKEMKDANKTSECRWITVKHFFKSLIDLPFYFLGLVSIIFFWRINYLREKIKTCEFEERGYVFRNNILYGVLDLPTLPMFMMIFICHWKWKGFYTEYKNIDADQYFDRYACIIMNFLALFIDFFCIVIGVLTIPLIWRFIPLVKKIKNNNNNPDNKLNGKEIKILVIKTFFNGLIDLPFIVILFFCAVAPWRLYILYQQYKESETDWEARTLILLNFLTIPIDLLTIIVLLPQLINWRIYYIKRDWENLNKNPVLIKNEWRLKHIIFNNFLKLFIDLIVLIEFGLLFILFNWRFWVYLKKKNNKNNNENGDDSLNFFQSGWYFLVTEEFFNGIFDLPFIPPFIVIFIFHWRFRSYNKQRKENELLSNWELRLLVFENFFYTIVDFFCLILATIVFLTWRQQTFLRKFKQLKNDNNDNANVSQNDKENFIRLLIVSQFFNLFPDLICIALSLLIFLTLWRIYWFVNSLRAKATAVERRKVVMYHLGQLIIDIPYFILYAITSMSLYRFVLMISDLTNYAENLDKNNAIRRAIIVEHFILLILDIFGLVCLIIIFITYYRYKKFRTELSNLNRKAFSGYEENATMSRLQPHFLLFNQFLYLLIDIPFLILFLIMSPFLWRSLWCYQLLKETLNDNEKRLVIMVQFSYLLLDIPLILPFIILVITYLRTGIILKRLKQIRNNEIQHTMHRYIFIEFIKLLFDLPFLPLIFIITITLWRSKHFLKNLKKFGDNNEINKKLFIIQQFLYWILDIPTFFIGIIVVITYWRYPDLKSALQSAKEKKELIKVFKEGKEKEKEKDLAKGSIVNNNNAGNYQLLPTVPNFESDSNSDSVPNFEFEKNLEITNNEVNNLLKNVNKASLLGDYVDEDQKLIQNDHLGTIKIDKINEIEYGDDSINYNDNGNGNGELLNGNEDEKLINEKQIVDLKSLEEKTLINTLMMNYHFIIWREFFYLILDLPIIILYILCHIPFWRSRIIRLGYKNEDNKTNNKMRRIIAIQGIFALLDLPMLIAFCITIVSWRGFRLRRLLLKVHLNEEEYQNFKREGGWSFNNLWLLLKNIPRIIFFAYSKDQHKLIFQEFFALFSDIPFIALSIVSLWRLIAIYYRIYKLKEPLTLAQRKVIILEEFARFILDVFCLPFFLILSLTIYRFPNIYSFLKAFDFQKNIHIFIMKEFFHLMFDVPFLPMFLLIFFTIYRYNVLKKKRNQASSEMEKRFIILNEFVQLIVDLPFIPFYFIIMITYVRFNALNYQIKKNYKHNMIKRWIILKNFISLLLDIICLVLTFFIYFTYFRRKKYQDDLKNNGTNELLIRTIILKHFIFLFFDLINLILFVFISIFFYWRSYLIQKNHANYGNNSFDLFCYIVVQLFNGILDFPFFILLILVCAFSFWRFKSLKDAVKNYDQDFATQFIIRFKILYNFLLIPLDYITIIIGSVLLMTTRRFSLKRQWVEFDFNQQYNQFDGFNIFNLNNENGDYSKYILVLLQTFLLFVDVVCLLMYLIILITYWRLKRVNRYYKYLKNVQNTETSIRFMILKNFTLLFFDIFCFILFVILSITWRNKLMIGELKLKNKMINENNPLRVYNINIGDRIDENDDILKINNDVNENLLENNAGDKIIENNDNINHNNNNNNKNNEIVNYDQDLLSLHYIVIDNFFGFLIDIPCVFFLIIIYLTLFRIKFYKRHYNEKREKIKQNEYKDQNNANDEELKKIVNLKIKYSAFHSEIILEIFQWLFDLPFVVLALLVVVTWRSPIIIKIYKQEIYDDDWDRRWNIFVNFFLLFFDLVTIMITVPLLFINLLFVWRIPTLYSFIKKGFTDVERKGDENYLYPKLNYFILTFLKLTFLSLYDVISIIFMLLIFVFLLRIKPFIQKFISMKRARITEEPDQDIREFYQNGINAMDKYESIQFPTSLTYYRSLINYEILQSLIQAPHLIVLPLKIIAYCLYPISKYIDWRFKNGEDYINAVSLMKTPIIKLNQIMKRNHTFNKIHWNFFIWFIVLVLLLVNEFSLIGLFFNWILLLLLTWFEPFRNKNAQQEDHQIPLRSIIYFRNICYIPIILFYQFLIVFLPSFIINPSFNFSKTYSNVEDWFWAIQIIWFVLMITSWYCLRRMVKRNFPSYQLFNSIVWMKDGCKGLFSGNFILWRYFKATLIFPTIWFYKFSKVIIIIGDLLYSAYFVCWVLWPVALSIYCIRKFGNSDDYYYLIIVIPISLFLSYVGIKISRKNWSKNPEGFPRKK